MEEKLPCYQPSKEPLPAYQPTNEYFLLALIQEEFSTPYHSNSDKWKPMMVELNLTQLRLYSFADKKLLQAIVHAYKQVNSMDDVLSNIRGTKKTSRFWLLLEKSVDLSAAYNDIRENNLLFEGVMSRAHFTALSHRYSLRLDKVYTLQNLQVGEAMLFVYAAKAMAKKKKSIIDSLLDYKNVLRLRAECSQFLMQCWSFHGMVQWYHHLIMARELAAPIEIRENVHQKLLPSRYDVRDYVLAVAGLMGQDQLMYLEQNSHQFIFDDIFQSGSSKAVIAGNDSDIESFNDLLFSHNLMLTRASLVASTSLAVTIGKYNFPSMEQYYSMVEMLYISSCIPSLNSFDKWAGKEVTISNASSVIPGKTLASDDVFLDYNGLPKNLQNRMNGKRGDCRTFMVHQHGLVLVALA